MASRSCLRYSTILGIRVDNVGLVSAMSINFSKAARKPFTSRSASCFRRCAFAADLIEYGTQTPSSRRFLHMSAAY